MNTKIAVVCASNEEFYHILKNIHPDDTDKFHKVTRIEDVRGMIFSDVIRGTLREWDLSSYRGALSRVRF